MNSDPSISFLVEAVLHELVEDAEALLTLAAALEGQASEIRASATPKKLRETAALVKSAALQITLAAANMVGAAERLRIVAEFGEINGDGGLPS